MVELAQDAGRLLPGDRQHLVGVRVRLFSQSRRLLFDQGWHRDDDAIVCAPAGRVWNSCLRNSTWDYRNGHDSRRQREVRPLIADGLTPIPRWGKPEDVAKAVRPSCKVLSRFRLERCSTSTAGSTCGGCEGSIVLYRRLVGIYPLTRPWTTLSPLIGRGSCPK